MRVTIIADASYCHQTKAAGYGYWIACDRGKRGGSGAFKDAVVNNNAAEMMALANALYMASRHGLVAARDVVLLQTDCQAAIAAFEGRRGKITQQELDIVRYMRRLTGELQLAVEYRHVKGHTDGSTPRLFINNQCDVLARDAMRKARNKSRSKT